MRFKAGDKVRVREDLEVDKWYGSQDFVDDMKRYRGEVVEIESKSTWIIGYHLKEDDENWIFTDEMFEPIEDPHNKQSDPWADYIPEESDPWAGYLPEELEELEE